VLYRLSYCGRPFGELPSRAHLISGTAPIGKENAGLARHRANPLLDIGINIGFA
jgi:hypothetical protein